VAIVFGAGLWWDGSPSPVLRDRVATAAQLYFSGKVKKILMSGDNRFLDYNEPGAMRAYALGLGVPETDIVLDYAGRRTYDTCYRARAIFGVQEAILVTQGFHLPRALYTCNQLGVQAIGVSADLRDYRRGALVYWHARETPATLVALWEVHLSRPLPVLGYPEPIFPKEAQ
jgi:SanA protein